MAHAENEVIINKPVAEVFKFLADGSNNSKWRDGVVSIELRAGNAGQLGAEYKQVLKGPGGRSIDGDYKITELVQDKEIEFSVIAGPVRPNGSYFFESEGNGAKLKFVLDYQPKGFTKLMGPMIQKTMNSEVMQLAKLKQVLES